MTKPHSLLHFICLILYRCNRNASYTLSNIGSSSNTLMFSGISWPLPGLWWQYTVLFKMSKIANIQTLPGANIAPTKEGSHVSLVFWWFMGVYLFFSMFWFFLLTMIFAFSFPGRSSPGSVVPFVSVLSLSPTYLIPLLALLTSWDL